MGIGRKLSLAFVFFHAVIYFDERGYRRTTCNAGLVGLPNYSYRYSLVRKIGGDYAIAV